MKGNEEKYKQVEEPEKVAETLGISSIMVQGSFVNAIIFTIILTASKI